MALSPLSLWLLALIKCLLLDIGTSARFRATAADSSELATCSKADVAIWRNHRVVVRRRIRAASCERASAGAGHSRPAACRSAALACDARSSFLTQVVLAAAQLIQFL